MTSTDELLDMIRSSSMQELLSITDLPREGLTTALMGLSLYMTAIPPSAQPTMLALHFGVLMAEIEEYAKVHPPKNPRTFEEHLTIFVEMARISYRDRVAAGFIESQANVPTPDRAM